MTFEFYMLNVKYWRIFCDVNSLLAQVLIFSFDRVYKEVPTKNIEIFLWLLFLWYDCTFNKQVTVPVTFTFDIWCQFLLLSWNSYTKITNYHKIVNQNLKNMAVIQPRPTILYQCAKFGDDRTSFNVIFDVCDV